MGTLGFNTSGQFMIGGNPVNYGKNQVINGDFRTWQRGTSFTIGGYTADRWLYDKDGTGGTITISQQSFSLDELGANTPQNFLRCDRTVALTGSTYEGLFTNLEDVRKYSSKTVTISFLAKALNSPFNLAVKTLQKFGTGGTPSAQVSMSNTVALSTSWQKFTITKTLPSIAGKILGSNNNSYLAIGFSIPYNSANSFDITQVQLEEGSVATPWTPYNGEFGGEVQACQRYLPTIEGGAYHTGQCASTANAYIPLILKTTPRIVPSGITLIGAVSNSSITNSAGGAIALTGLSYNQASLHSILLLVSVASGVVGGYATLFNPGANRILITGCEL